MVMTLVKDWDRPERTRRILLGPVMALCEDNPSEEALLKQTTCADSQPSSRPLTSLRPPWRKVSWIPALLFGGAPS